MIENTISIDSSEGFDIPVWGDVKAEDNTSQQEDMAADGGENSTEQTAAAEEEKAELHTAQETVDTIENPEVQQGETVELNLYGSKMQVPLEEAKQAAQKGFAFEHIKAQLEARKNDARIKTLENIAQIKGTTISQLLCAIQSEAVRDSLTQQYGDFETVPQEAISKAVADLEQTRTSIAQSEEEIARQGWKAQLRNFVAENPGVKEIPPQVIDTAKAGVPLADAYSRYGRDALDAQLKEAKLELEMLKSQSSAAKKAMPSATNTAENKTRSSNFAQRMKSTW